MKKLFLKLWYWLFPKRKPVLFDIETGSLEEPKTIRRVVPVTDSTGRLVSVDMMPGEPTMILQWEMDEEQKKRNETDLVNYLAALPQIDTGFDYRIPYVGTPDPPDIGSGPDIGGFSDFGGGDFGGGGAGGEW